MNRRKLVLMSTPLSPMIVILLGMMIYVMIDLKYQTKALVDSSARVESATLLAHQHNDSHEHIDDHRHPLPLMTGPRGHYHPHGHERFRKIGFLTSRELADSVILPLFGEPAPYRRHRWNYYTMTDAHQSLSSVKLPVMYRDRSCVDEVACDEIYTGDVVRVHGYEAPFVVEVY